MWVSFILVNSAPQRGSVKVIFLLVQPASHFVVVLANRKRKKKGGGVSVLLWKGQNTSKYCLCAAKAGQSPVQ